MGCEWWGCLGSSGSVVVEFGDRCQDEKKKAESEALRYASYELYIMNSATTMS